MQRTVLRMLDEAAGKWGTAGYAHRRTDAGWESVSFVQAREQARELAAWLVSTGARPGDAMAIIAEGSPEWIVSEFGLLMAGCVSVPLSIKLLEEEIPFRINHSRAAGIVTTKNQLNKVLGSLRSVESAAVRIIYLDDDPDWAREEAAAQGVSADRVTGIAEARAHGRKILGQLGSEIDGIMGGIGENDTVTICYTSGTTGNPKGIMLTHLNYWTNCHDAVKAIDLPLGGGRSSFCPWITPLPTLPACTRRLFAASPCILSIPAGAASARFATFRSTCWKSSRTSSSRSPPSRGTS